MGRPELCHNPNYLKINHLVFYIFGKKSCLWHYFQLMEKYDNNRSHFIRETATVQGKLWGKATCVS